MGANCNPESQVSSTDLRRKHADIVGSCKMSANSPRDWVLVVQVLHLSDFFSTVTPRVKPPTRAVNIYRLYCDYVAGLHCESHKHTPSTGFHHWPTAFILLNYFPWQLTHSCLSSCEVVLYTQASWIKDAPTPLAYLEVSWQQKVSPQEILKHNTKHRPWKYLCRSEKMLD